MVVKWRERRVFPSGFFPQKTFKCLSDLTRGERWNRPPVRNLSNPLQMIEKHTRLLICIFSFCYSNSKFVPFSFFLFFVAPPGRSLRCDVWSETRWVARSQFAGVSKSLAASQTQLEQQQEKRGKCGRLKAKMRGEGGIVGAGTHGSALSQRQSDNRPFRRFHTRDTEMAAALSAGLQSFQNKITLDIWRQPADVVRIPLFFLFFVSCSEVQMWIIFHSLLH